mgnify:FL=1
MVAPRNAQRDLEDMEKAWRKFIPRIQFRMERDEINNLGISVARARAAITAKDQAGALKELEDAASHWHNLGN